MMKRIAIALCLVLVCLAGCNREPPPKPTPPPPPPKTGEQLHGQVMDAVRPLINGAPESGQLLKGALSSELGKLRTEVNGEKGRSLVETDIKDALKAAYDGERWQEVLNLCDAVDVMDQGNTRVLRYRERAIAEKNKPQVTMKGVFQIDGTPTIFLDVYLPETDKTADVKVRVGEEFYGLILEKILGDKEGVQLKYLKTEQSFTVPGVGQ
jgi:hypothetical protein